MKTIYNGSGATVTLYWKIMRGENKVTEDLYNLKSRVFLIGSCNTYSMEPDVVTDEEFGNKVLKVEVDASVLCTGVYDVKAMWEKNDGRNIMKSARTGVFAITDNSEEVDEIKSEEVIRIASYVESIGRDGLSAYEIAVIRGLNNGLSENDWVGNEAGRIKAEQERASAETTRKENETARTNEESGRQSRFNTFMTESSGAFSDAQTDRDTAFSQAQGDRDAEFKNTLQGFKEDFEEAEAKRNDGETIRNINYKTVEATRNTNYAIAEATRNEEYKKAEATRNSTIDSKLSDIEIRFKDAEDARKTIFNNNEDSRQTNEQYRIQAEGKREKDFQDNEKCREQTFQDNEVTRQSNEIKREEQESIRQQAEQIRIDTFDENERGRISAENERKQNEVQREANEAIRQESYKDKLPMSAVVQETGDRADLVMSQKVVSGKLSVINAELSKLDWVELSVNANLMYDGNGIITSPSEFRSIIVPVLGETLRTKGHWYTIAFLEEYPSVGASIVSAVAWNPNYADPRSITVPDGAKYAMFTVATAEHKVSINASNKSVNESLSALFGEKTLMFSSLGEEYVEQYGYGIRDINVISNGGHDKIKLSALYKTSDKFLCQFTDVAGRVLCQKYITDPANLPIGLNNILCEEYQNSGVSIEILLDADNISTTQEILSVQPVIKEKDTYPSAIKTNNHVRYVEKGASNDASSRIQELVKIDGRFINIRIQRANGLPCLWKLYTCTDESYSNLTLVKDDLISEVDYSFDLGMKYPYVYIFSTPNPRGFSGYLKWNEAETLAEKSELLNNMALPNSSAVLAVNIDSGLNESRVMALADNVGKVVKCNFKKEAGEASVYSVFASQTPDLSDIELIAEKLEFDKEYILELRVMCRYLYIYTPSHNPNGFKGNFIYSPYGEAISDKVKDLEHRLNNGEKITYKPFLGKTIVCFGDSVTEFGNYPAGIAARTGATVYNVGFGGCHLAKRRDTSSEGGNAYDKLSMYNLARFVVSRDFTELDAAVEYIKENEGDDNTSIAERLKSVDFNNVDIITIFYGTNDYTQGGKTFGDIDSEDISTFRGAINYIVKTIQTAYPHISIVFITPTHRLVGTDNADSDKIVISELTLSGIADCIVEQANINHVPAINMYKESGFNAYNHACYFADGVHPNQQGYDHIADRLSAYLCGLFKFK